MGLTRHKAAKGQSPLSNEVSPNRIVVPNKKSHQSYFGHVDGESECFLPNRIKPWQTNRAEVLENKPIASTSLSCHGAQHEA